jgi:hypothetical protein
MTSNEKLDKIVANAMTWLKESDFKKHVEHQYRENRAVAKEEAKKRKMRLDRFEDMYPDEWYAYVKFDDDGEIDGYDIDHAQYWHGHGGPTVTIFLTPKLDWEDVDREIGNTLADALDLEDD